ncbi:methylornithine synthase PylB [Pectinatus brassicae]|uniref:Methylornithine synthase n=1 Tax=Pectinatus brassicae TaxID=862415 RepID=A0A840URY2_9FIRM|nr:methylornithine synthase PylB [Pectinatus brassicae]MBB5337508.1 methylornithine synthase [Pectinatus brassicae]
MGFYEALEKVSAGEFLNQEEIAVLLSTDDEQENRDLFTAACKVRNKCFSNKVFLYGFVYFSTYCRNKCNFCFYRAVNKSIRYRKSLKEIVDIAVSLKKSGIHLIDLTMGEDPYYLDRGKAGYDELLNIIKQVKKATNLPVMISPGTVSEKLLEKMKDSGAEWYACYQETHNLNLYNKLRPDQPYQKRYNSKLAAKENGLLIEEGLLTGLGENVYDIAASFYKMKELEAQQIRVMTFVPQKGTPMEQFSAHDNKMELKIIAVMRLLFPDRLIPASLDVEGIDGLKKRINAGANVVTSIIPPDSGLAGVSQSTLNIKDGWRTVQGVVPILQECGLAPASVSEYKNWLKNEEHKNAEENCGLRRQNARNRSCVFAS